MRLASQGVNVVLVAKPDNMLEVTHQELETTFPNLQFRKVGKAGRECKQLAALSSLCQL